MSSLLRSCLVPVLLGLALAACGGGDSDDAHSEAVERANAKEAQARSLANGSPCSSTAQCTTLSFMSPQHVCADRSYAVYSTASPSAAAASAAAAEQNQLAVAARNLERSDLVCAAVVAPAPPALICQANRCDTLVTVTN